MRRLIAALMVLVAPLALVSLISTTSCVGSKKAKKDTDKSATLDKYIKSKAPAGIKQLDINFDDKITLLGYKMKKQGPVKPGDRIKFTMYWKVNKPLTGDGWKLFTHIMDSKNKKILNIDNVGPLRDSGSGNEQLHPPSKWKAGKVYVDSQTFTVPKRAKGDEIKIVTGIWKGSQRVAIKAGPQIGEDRALIASLRVKGKKSRPNTRVPELKVHQLEADESIKIDGKLDDKAWSHATSTGPFVNVATGDKDDKSPVQGSAKLLWDDKYLYVGFEVQDSDVVGGFDEKAKDPHLWTKDCVELMIDPDGDGDNKDYYEIQVGPQNLVFDSQFDDYNKPRGGDKGPFGHQDWSSELKSAVSIDGTLDKPGDKDKGYTVELQLPWSSLSKAKTAPPKAGQKWRINLYAMQNNSGVGWSPILKQGNFHKASRFGRVIWAVPAAVQAKADANDKGAKDGDKNADAPADKKVSDDLNFGSSKPKGTAPTKPSPGAKAPAQPAAPKAAPQPPAPKPTPAPAPTP